MFTGIIQARAQVSHVRHDPSGLLTLHVQFPNGFCADLQRGASIAVDGVCLTVTEQPAPDVACFDVMARTLELSTLARFVPPHTSTCAQTPDRSFVPNSLGWVNVERAARQGAEIGGHPLSGHVDGIARITAIDRSGAAQHVIHFAVPPALAAYLFTRGYIAIDGASLTIVQADRSQGTFSVSLIPETLRVTTLGEKSVGDAVNVELERATVAMVDTLREQIRTAVREEMQYALGDFVKNPRAA